MVITISKAVIHFSFCILETFVYEIQNINPHFNTFLAINEAFNRSHHVVINHYTYQTKALGFSEGRYHFVGVTYCWRQIHFYLHTQIRLQFDNTDTVSEYDL